MKKNPIHKNLNTSFVNLADLVRYLQNLQFVGSIHVELISYEADIEFAPNNKIRAREYDHIASRITLGEHALRRILVRAKEPCGRITVYNGSGETALERIFVDESIASAARQSVFGDCDNPVKNFIKLTPVVMEQAADTREFVNVAAELLRTIEKSLAKGNLSFTSAFHTACGLIAEKHPFMDPNTEFVSYNNGVLTVDLSVPSEMLVEGIGDALLRIVARLRERPGFLKLLSFMLQRIQSLMIRRREVYDRYSLTPQLQKLMESGTEKIA